MEKPDLLWKMLEIIVFLLPVCCLIWNAAKQSSKIDDHDRRLEKLEENYQADITQIKETINALNLEFAKTFTKLSEKLDYLSKSIREKDE